MKTILSSILLALLVITTSEPIRSNKDLTEIDAILAKSQKNMQKATKVTKVADQQQKAKMTELHETVTKLEEEKQTLQTTLEETKYELQTAKEVINNAVVDTGERFELFPEN